VEGGQAVGHPGLAKARERRGLPVAQRRQRLAQRGQHGRVQAALERDGGGAGRRQRAPVVV
jgi:hypothetical protein